MNFLIKEDGKYVITRAGKSEYSRMLQNYDLDRQTILEVEGKRIEEINNKTVQFFEKFKVKDKDVQFRFLTNILTLDYERVKPILKEEQIFHKILLFLSINHPDHYPNFISSEDFSKFYKIKRTTLDYYIDEISEGKIYPLRFFKLRQPSGEQYYFQSDGTLEKMLQIITEKIITKISYLNKLFSKPTPYLSTIDMKSIINDIVNKSCEFLFNKELSASLTEFLPEYIKDLAYKIETKKELIGSYDKLEGIIWQNMSEIIQIKESDKLDVQYKERVKEIEKELESDPMNIDLYYSKIRILIYFNQYSESLKLLDDILEIFPENEKDIKIKKASVLKKMKNIESGLEIINDLIQKYPKDHDLLSYKAYWLQFLDKKEEAIAIIKNLIENEPDIGIYYDTYGEILMYFEEYEEAAKKFVKAMVLGGHDWYLYQTYIKLGICYTALGNLELGIKNLNKGKDIINESINDPDTKKKWLSIVDIFLGPIEAV